MTPTLIQKAGILLLTVRLWQETDPERRERLRESLLLAEDAHGILWEQIQMAQDNLAFSENRLLKQEEAIARLSNIGADTSMAERTLALIQDAHDMHRAYCARIERVALMTGF